MKLTRVAEMFKLLGERTRFRIVNLLGARDELCVQTLQRTLGEPQAKISRHLFTLKAAGFVTYRRDGQMMLYSLARTQNAHQTMLINCIKDHYSTLPELQADLRHFDDLDQKGLLCCRPKSGG